MPITRRTARERASGPLGVEQVPGLAGFDLDGPIGHRLQPGRELPVDLGTSPSRERNKVSLATVMARNSLVRPSRSTAKVAGSSRVRMIDQPV